MPFENTRRVSRQLEGFYADLLLLIALENLLKSELETFFGLTEENPSLAKDFLEEKIPNFSRIFYKRAKKELGDLAVRQK